MNISLALIACANASLRGFNSHHSGNMFHKNFFVMAHDSATGYYDSPLSIANPYVKTQSGSFTDQLTCGARALDLRLGYDNENPTLGDDLRFHHGGAYINGLCGPDTYSAPSSVADCPSGYTNMGATCYRGPDTYSAASSVADCPSGYTNMGASCYRWQSLDTKGMDEMTCPSDRFKNGGRCYVNCAAGYTNNGETCGRGADTKSWDEMTCPSDRFRTGGRCYVNCRHGYTNNGETCGATHSCIPTVQNTIPLVKLWAQENPTELVVLVLSHCFGDGQDLNDNSPNGGNKGCKQDRNAFFSQPFEDLGIHVYDKAYFSTMQLTIEEVKQKARLPGGGMVVAMYGESNYINSTFDGIYGAQDIDSEFGKYYWDDMFSYFNNQLGHKQLHQIAGAEAPWQLQAIWQETDAGSYLTPGFSIIGQTLKSKINHVLLQLANGGYFNGKTLLTSQSFDPDALGLGEASTDQIAALKEHSHKTGSVRDWKKYAAPPNFVNFLLMNMVADQGYAIAEAMGAKSPVGAQDFCDNIVTDW